MNILWNRFWYDNFEDLTKEMKTLINYEENREQEKQRF